MNNMYLVFYTDNRTHATSVCKKFSTKELAISFCVQHGFRATIRNTTVYITGTGQYIIKQVGKWY